MKSCRVLVEKIRSVERPESFLCFDFGLNSGFEEKKRRVKN
jgi:hypothetical protein